MMICLALCNLKKETEKREGNVKRDQMGKENPNPLLSARPLV